MRDTVLLFTNLKEPVEAMTDDQAGQLFKAILSYQSGEEVELDGLLNVIFLQIKQQIDYSNGKYNETCKKRSEAGKKGMESRWKDNKAKDSDNKNNNAITNDNKAITSDNKNNHNDNDNDNDIKESIERKRKRFVPPTLDEIRAYCQERNNSVNPQKFFDYYEQGGWKDSEGKPVKNWKQKLITWENKTRGEPKKPWQGMTRSNIDFEEMKRRALVN